MRISIALELNYHAHAVFVGFVAQIFDAVNFFLLDQLGNFFDHFRFVDLIGDFGDDNLELSVFDFLNFGLGARDNVSFAGKVRRGNILLIIYDTAGREVRALN